MALAPSAMSWPSRSPYQATYSPPELHFAPLFSNRPHIPFPSLPFMKRLSSSITSGLTHPTSHRWFSTVRTLFATITTLGLLALISPSAHASTAYGSINNFDVVNDTGSHCHGFEIELEDIASTEITYTYDWNHYGKSKFIPSTTAQGRPATCVRWESAKKTDGSWAAYTAIPAGPIQPTDGHQFTNPNVNFGGEHFGVGYTANPTAVRYFWLLDDGSGNLVRGPEVQVSTPVFNYAPAVVGAAAQVQAIIEPVVPELPDLKEFGDAVWVKEIRTSTHNNNEVKLRDLVSDDPDKPDDKNWRNGEPDEVEVEWQLLQTDYNKADGGANGELAAAPEDLDDGDEVVTRRYEFFKYTGPFDDESGEAKADNVGPDDVHGEGIKTVNGVEVDLSTIEVVGEYIGAQMAAFDAASEVGLIDQIPDANLNAEYPARRVIIAGAVPFTATTEGQLPDGMAFDTVTGILSGTPTEPGTFTIDVNAQEGALPAKTKTYSFIVAEEGANPLPQSVVDTTAQPVDAGTLTGSGTYENGTEITTTATAEVGFTFVNWTDNGTVVSNNSSYTFTTNVNRSLTANFAPIPQNFTVTLSSAPANLGTANGAGTFAKDSQVNLSATPNAGATFLAWTENGVPVSSEVVYQFPLTANRTLAANFARLFTVTATANPAIGGSVIGGGLVVNGTDTSLTASPNLGYTFVSWTETGNLVSTNPTHPLVVTRNRSLTANFQLIHHTPPPGSYAGLVITNEAPVSEGTGLISVKTGPAFSFSGTLKLGSSSVPLKGRFDSTGQAHLTFTRRGKPTLAVDLQYTVENGLTGTVGDGTLTSHFDAQLCPYSKANVLTDWPGLYTNLIAHPPILQVPLTVGVGVHTIGATGVVRLVGQLSDGSSYLCSSYVTDAGTFPLYSPTKRPGFAGFVAGDIALDDNAVGSATLGSQVQWKPATAQPLKTLMFYMNSYTPPAKNKAAINVDLNVPNLSIGQIDGLGDPLQTWSMRLGPNNAATDLVTGPGPISLRITKGTGSISGRLNDGTLTRAFFGVIWQSTCQGFGIIPELGDQHSLTIIGTCAE